MGTRFWVRDICLVVAGEYAGEYVQVLSVEELGGRVFYTVRVLLGAHRGALCTLPECYLVVSGE